MSDLLTIEEIAALHRCDSRRARDVIVRQPGFPVPAPTSTPRRRLWVRNEVKAFINRKHAQIPHDARKAA